MKKLVVLTMILAFAGNLIAQQAPATAPTATQQKHDDGKKHHHHHHGHDHKGDHKDDHKK